MDSVVEPVNCEQPNNCQAPDCDCSPDAFDALISFSEDPLIFGINKTTEEDGKELWALHYGYEIDNVYFLLEGYVEDVKVAMEIFQQGYAYAKERYQQAQEET